MSKRFKTGFLHIGTEKTGSTAIQRLMHLNYDRLQTDGFFVPKSLSSHVNIINHKRLTTYALRDEKVDRIRKSVGVSNPDLVEGHRASVERELETEICNASCHSENLLVSNEHCQSRLTTPQEVLRIKLLLNDYCEQFRVIVFIRPQYELAISAYSQALRAGHFDIDLLPLYPQGKTKRRWVDRRLFDYDALLQRWQEVFGNDSLAPFIYRNTATGGVIDDFTSILGVPLHQYQLPERRNEALGATAQKFLNVMNRAIHNTQAPLPAKERARLIRTLEGLPDQRRHFPSRVDVSNFQAQFEAGNESLRKTWFPDRHALFDDDLSRFPEEVDDVELSVDDFMSAFLKLASQIRTR